MLDRIGNWISKFREHYVLPYKRLLIKNQFLIDLQVQEKKFDKTILYSNHRYYRYMDRIFSPVPIKKLSVAQVIAMCDLRLEYFDNLVDKNFNQSVLKNISNFLPKKDFKNILDFGCGNGEYTKLIKDNYPAATVYGIDISEKAIGIASVNTDIQWMLISENAKLKFEDNQFDLILSSFVMHFNINSTILCELNRILTNDGYFIFNIFNRKYLHKDFYAKMEGAGFSLNKISSPNFAKDHIFFIATKNPYNVDKFIV